MNHRFFSPSLKLPASLARWEGEVREQLRRRVSRGHLTVTARVERPENERAAIDETKFARFASSLIALRDRHGLGGDVDVATVLRMPEVLRFSEEDTLEGSAAELAAIVDAAAAELTRARDAEGARLAEVLRERLAVVEGALGRIAERAPSRVTANRDRLRENVKVLAAGVQVDEQRLAQEIAILADRLDVGEEIDRFRSHLTAFRETLAARSEEPVGKRLGFLLQEMLREANTTGSKANDALMQRDVVVMKEELERIREQVENLE